MMNHDPLSKMQQWLAEAKAHPQISEPTAMALATSDERSMPSVRIVLLKGLDENGVVFYTNNESQKGRELTVNPQASVCFYWMPMQRQMRVSGQVTPVSTQEADVYFAGRRRGSQIGAHASQQSQPLESFETLIQRTKALEEEYEGKEILRPQHWSGWRISLQRIEFWQEGEFRLHEREVYLRGAKGWQHSLLNP